MMIVAVVLLVVLAFFLGASLASFGAVVVERAQRRESINGRSHCVCERQLEWWENIPVVGWVSARGVTRCCQQKIPLHYVVTEVLVGALFAVAAAVLLAVYFSSP